MYSELVKELRDSAEWADRLALLMGRAEGDAHAPVMRKAADAIKELSAKVDRLQLFADNISKLPDCNTCIKKNLCEFMPKYGEYCRINCPAWLGKPPKEE